MSQMKKISWLLFGVVILTLVIASQCKAAEGDDTFVTGILSVPYKWHLADKSITVGSTIGGYIGYQTKAWKGIEVTPIIGGGLALVSGDIPGLPGTSTSAGVSLASGLIGTVGTTNIQWGVLTGIDWLGRSANYRYEGKPWLAFEVGYNFRL